MPISYTLPVGDTIRDREFGLTSLLPDLESYDFGSQASSLDYFQNLLSQTTRADLGQREKGSLYDLIGGAAWGFTDMATAHLLRGSWAFDTGGQPLAEAVGGVDLATKSGMYAEQAGEALGFLPPMKRIGTALRWGVKVTEFGSKAVAKKLAADTSRRLAEKGAVQFTSKKAAVEAGGRSASKHFYEGVNDKWIKRWYNTTGPAKVDGFGTAFSKVADKNRFITSVNTKMAKELSDEATRRGVKLGKGVADGITGEFAKYFTDPRKFPVSSISEMVARRWGIEGKLATAYTHMFEEAVTFATFEGLLEVVDSVQQDRDYDMGRMGHAAIMGHVLGAVRFIPGGKKSGGTLFGQGGGIDQYKRMMKNLKPFKGRIDPSNEAHRRGTYKLWNYLYDGNPFRNKNQTGKVLDRFAVEHPLWKSGVFRGKKAVTINTMSPSNVATVLKDGTKQQKEAMGTIMRDSLDKVRMDYKRDWLPQFMKEWRKDVKGSLPRMFIGGVAMGGGPSIFFDENLSLEDKIFAITLGGLMMRRGHELSTRRVTTGKDGNTSISFVAPSGMIGAAKPTAYGDHFERMTNDIRRMGGNPWTWGGYNSLMTGRGSSHLDIMDSIPVGDTVYGKKIKGVLENTKTKAGNSVITTEGELKVHKASKTDPPESVMRTYETYIQAARNLVPVETKIKGWENLSSTAKKQVAKELAKKEFRTPEDILEARVADSIDILSTGDKILGHSLVDAVAKVGIPLKPDSNGVYRLPILKYEGAHRTETMDAIDHYNAYADILEKSGKIKIDASEEIGNPQTIITPETKGLDEFTSQMQTAHQAYSNIFGYTKESQYEIHPSSQTFQDLINIKTFFENKINAKNLMDIISGESKINSEDVLRDQKLELARTLWTKIFKGKGGQWRGYIKLKPEKGNYRNQRFVNNVQRLAMQTAIVRHGVSGRRNVKDESVPVDNVNQLREIFRSEGVNMFEQTGRLKDIFVEQMFNENKKSLMEAGGMLGKNNKKVPISPEAMNTVIALSETGFLNEHLTMMKWGKYEDIFSKYAAENNIDYFEMFVNGNKKSYAELSDAIKAYSKGEDTSNITPKNVEFMAEKFKEMVEILKDNPAYEGKTSKDVIAVIKGDIKYIFKTLEDRIRPLIRTVDKSGNSTGFIRVNPKDTVHLTPEGVISLKSHMLALDKTRANSDMDAFITELATVHIDGDKRMKGFTDWLLGTQMTRQNWKRTDSIKLMEMATAHKIYNPIERKFETLSMDKLKVDDAVRSIMKSFTRGDVDSAAKVESWMKEVEDTFGTDGQGENGYSSMTFAELTRKYDFGEYDFALGATDTMLDRQINSKGGVEPADVQLQSMYDKYFGDKNRLKFMNHMIKAAITPKKDGTKFKGDIYELTQEVGKAFLDMSNTITTPVLHWSERPGGLELTMNQKNKTRRSEQSDAIERAAGGEPGVTNSVAIIPEIFRGVETIRFTDKVTGETKKELRPRPKVLTEGVSDEFGNVIYPNEELINQGLFEGNRLVLDATFKRAEDGTLTQAGKDDIISEKSVLYIPGRQEWGYSVPMNDVSIRKIAETFMNKLETGKVPTELADTWLKELHISYKSGFKPTKVYDVVVDMMENPKVKDKTGDLQDVWVVDSLAEAEAQLASMKDGLGGAKNFDDAITPRGDHHVLKHKYGDDKHIYIRGTEPEGLQRDPKGRTKGEPYIKDVQHPGADKWELNENALTNHMSAAKWVKKIFDISTGMDVFGKNYINDRMYDMQGAKLGELIKRAGLWSSANQNKLRRDVISDISALYKEHGDSTMQKHAKVYDRMLAGKDRRVVMQDELKGDRFDIFSNHKLELEPMLEALDIVDSEKADAIKNTLGQIAELERFIDTHSSPSSQDSGTVSAPDRFNALAALYGAKMSHNIGGIKGNMLRTGGDFFVSKTGFTKNSEYNQFFIDNPDVAQIEFTSGNKQINGKYYGKTANSINPAVEGWESSKDLIKMPISIEDYNLTFIKGNKTKSIMPPNAFMDLGKTAGEAAYDYYLHDNVTKGIDELTSLHKINNYPKAVALNKFWNKNSNESSSVEWQMESPLAEQSMLANANIIPYINPHSKSWEQNIKTQILDPILRPRIDGSQFVHQAPHPNETVRNSIHYWDGTRNRIHRFGEGALPSTVRHVGFDKNNIFFVKVKDINDPVSDTSNDLLTWKDVKESGEKTRDRYQIVTDRGVFFVENQAQTKRGTETKHGIVLKSKIIGSEAGEWWQSTNIGELNDRLPDGYQIFSYGRRDPVIGGDSTIPLLIRREFKDMADGNVGTLNEMDGQMSAELDNDIDTINMWWNGPREYANKIIDRKGEVLWATPPTKNSKSSMDGLRPFDWESHKNYRGKLKTASMMKGKLMNYQSIIDWLWKHNTGSMLTAEGSQGFQIGRNVFAAIRGDAIAKQKIKAKLRSDIQGIVDGTGGYDESYYRKWETDFLFTGPAPLFHAYNSLEGKGMVDISKQVPVNAAGQKMIIDFLITPYRRFKSLVNGKWEGSKRKKIKFDELIEGVRNYDSEMRMANFRAMKQAKNTILFGDDVSPKSIFNGWNYGARLFGKSKGWKDMLPADRLLASVVSMDYRNMLHSPPSGTRNPYEYADIVETMIHAENPSDFARIWGKEFTTFSEQQFFIKSLQNKRDRLMKIAAEVRPTNPKMSRDLYIKSREINKIIDRNYKSATFKYRIDKSGKPREQYGKWNKKKQQMDWVDKKKGNREFAKIWENASDNWREQLVYEATKNLKGEKKSEAITAWHIRNNTYGYDKKRTKDSLVRQKLSKRGLVVEAYPDHDMISALAAQDAFGLLAHNEPYKYSSNPSQVKSIHQEMLNEANKIGEDYPKEYREWNRGNRAYSNEAEIEQSFMDRLNEGYDKYHDIGGTNLANNFLWQFMTPKFDLSKLVVSGSRTYFAPQQRGWGTRVLLGLRFIARTDKMLPEAKQTIANEYAAGVSRSFLRFNMHKGQTDIFMSNQDVMKRDPITGAMTRRNENGLLDIRNLFKINPLDYSKSGGMADVLSEVHPGFQGMSVSLSYKEMLNMFGSGGIPQLLDLHRAFYLPDAAVTDVSRYGPHMATSGYPAFLRAKKMGVRAYVENEHSRTTLDPEGTFKHIKPLGEYGREKDLLESINERYSEIICNQGNG